MKLGIHGFTAARKMDRHWLDVCCIFLKLCCKHNTLVDAQRGHTLARLNNGLLDDKKMPFLYMSH